MFNITGVWWRSARQAARSWSRRRGAQGKKGKSRIGLLLLLAALLGVFAWSLSSVFTAPAPGQKLSLDQLMGLAKQGRVATATLLDADDRLIGTLVEAAQADAVSLPSAAPKLSAAAAVPAVPDVPPAASGRFYVDYPASAPLTVELYRALSASHATITVDKQKTKQQLKLVTTFLLPLLILATVFAVLLAPKGKGGAIGGIADFSTVRSGKQRKAGDGAGFGNAGGVHEAVVELREVVDYLRDPGKYEALGAAPPKGVLLFGPPGCGKTLLAKSVAGEAGVPFFSVAGAEFVEALVGVGAARVRDLFSRVRAAAPAIVFIDELDAAGRKRGAGGSSGGSDEREQTLNQLLVEMDGFDSSKGIVVIGATNRPDILDPALRRPGRFDRHITIERPDSEGRLEILKIHARNKPVSPLVDFERIAIRTPGFTGADLANVVNEAALLTIRDARDELTDADLDEAIRRVLEGPKRKGHLLSDSEKQRASQHEAGHVVLSLAMDQAHTVQRVSILGGGKAIATTELRSDDEETVLTEGQLRAKIAVLMAGASAERLVFGDISTGVEHDLEQATVLARDIVARYGMVPGLSTRLLAGDASAFLGAETPWADISEAAKSAADSAIQRLLDEAVDTADITLELHRPALDVVATALREHETLEGATLKATLVATQHAMATAPVRRATSRRTVRT